MIEWFTGILATNSVAQGVFAGALAAAPMTALVWFCKDMPGAVFNAARRQLSRELIIFSYTDNYHEIVDYGQKFIFWSRSHQINDSSKRNKDHELGIGLGTHWGKYNGVYFKLHKELQDSQGVSQFKEKSTFTFYTRNKKVKEQFFQEAVSSLKEDKPIRIRENEGSYWDVVGDLSPRPYDSVVYRDKDKLLKFIKTFLASEQNYLDKGVPYHTGVLLHGEPGTGKTSLIHALAHKLQRDICYLNPNIVKGGQLMGLLAGNWNSKILVIEDIDVSGAKVDRKAGSDDGITLSELLNSLDGIATPHGMITIATTNHIDSLDPALIRPGRFDYVLEVGKLQLEEAQQLAAKFEAQLPEPYTPMTGVELRNYFLKNSS